MKILILYRPDSEQARSVETFVRDLRMQHLELADSVTLTDIDSREGQDIARINDIWTHPAVLVTRDDGSPLKDWRDGTLPQMNEVATYAYSN